MSRNRIVSRDLNPLLSTLPPKFTTIYPYQVDAITEIVDHFDNGAKVVVLEAPTGTGKSIVAECVRRLLQTRATYVCHNKDLQTQLASDFDYSKVLYGRSNYRPTKTQIMDVTCEDCTSTPKTNSCVLCNPVSACPYRVAKDAAIHSPVPVLNSAYWLNECQSPKSRFANTGLCIMDEADTLESVLMGQVEVYISPRRQAQMGIGPPRFLTKADSFVGWADTALAQIQPFLDRALAVEMPDVRQTRELRRVAGLVETINQMKADLLSDSPWVYTGGAGSERRRGDEIAFKPVKVANFGKDRIWNHDKRFLLMSATIVSAGQLLDSLGWVGDYGTVTVDSQFHPKNRQVVIRPVADMSRKGLTDEGFGHLGRAVQHILREHDGERVVVHSVSYSLTERLTRVCQTERQEVFTYRMAAQRSAALSDFIRNRSSVLVAPSADRGVDLRGELCRAQILVKMPFLSLGDKQTSERLYNTSDGQVWYAVETARTIMQMVGRGVRNVDDWCVAYVLDSQFVKFYRQWGHLFPRWFRKAIRVENA